MSRPYNSQASSYQSGHREIKPQMQSVITQPNIMPQVQIIQQNPGMPFYTQMIPVQTQNQPMMMAIQPSFQTNGNSTFSNIVQVPNQMISIPNQTNSLLNHHKYGAFSNGSCNPATSTRLVLLIRGSCTLPDLQLHHSNLHHSNLHQLDHHRQIQQEVRVSLV